MKAVLISIQPKWCEKIVDGVKTIEIRKSKPKIGTPFKCYIYCTKGDMSYPTSNGMICNNSGGGIVIGEFVCRNIIPISVTYSNPNSHLALSEFPLTGMTDKQVMEYLGNGGLGYGWVISDLLIYDKPLELHGFKKYNRDCKYSDLGLAIPRCSDCTACNLKRPPQSWCYVEEEK